MVDDIPSGPAEVIFYGGDIVTVADDASAPEAVAVRDGRIVFVGPLAQALVWWQGPDTRMRDLRGQALLPGFIDPHGHIGGTGLQATIANLLAAPDGDVTDIASVADKLREFAASEVGQRAEWIVGFGYDDAILREGRHPTRDDLDAVSTDRPVLAIHQSFHLGAVNSKGLELLGYTADTPDPDGGVIRRRTDGEFVPPHGEPNGVLEEAAFNPASDAAISGLHPDDLARLLARGQAAAASFGFTTVQEGAATFDFLASAKAAAAAGGLYLDLVVYVKAEQAVRAPELMDVSQEYTDGLRTAGVKMILDGSPQGRTAWFTQPYLTPPDGQEPGYRGYPAVSDETALDQVETAFANGWQVIAHVNGDAAIDQFIGAVRVATERSGQADRRPVAIHAQTAREDQVDGFRELGVIPSFFSMHTFYWGDWYVETVLGPGRAATISPARWALDRGMTYTSHHDAPVALPNSLAILSSQVTRITRSGAILGPDQRVSALDAVRSITINAARQYFEEDTKGSIEPGKLADLVILSANPLTVAPERIHDITIVETIKAGYTVHPASRSTSHDRTYEGANIPIAVAPHC